MAYGIATVNSQGNEMFLSDLGYITQVGTESLAYNSQINSSDPIIGNWYEASTFPSAVTVDSGSKDALCVSQLPAVGCKFTGLPMLLSINTGTTSQWANTCAFASSQTLDVRMYQIGSPTLNTGKDGSTYGAIIYDSNGDPIFDSRNRTLACVGHYLQPNLPSSWDLRSLVLGGGAWQNNAAIVSKMQTAVTQTVDVTVQDAYNNYFIIYSQSLFKAQAARYNAPSWNSYMIYSYIEVINQTTIRFGYLGNTARYLGTNHFYWGINEQYMLPIEIYEFT